MDTPDQGSYNYLNKYLTEIRGQGRYSFTLEELKSKFNLAYPAIKQGLFRLKAKKSIAQVRHGFYVIIPPEYSNQGMLPLYMFLDDLMVYLDKDYYLALLSAAALHGAGHQQPMEYFAITQSPAPRSIKNKKLKVIFSAKSKWSREGIIQKKTNAGYVNVSSPELTALDLFDHAHEFGINRITSVLMELAQEMKIRALTRIAKQYSNTAAIQRLGFIFEKVLSEEKLAEPLLKILKGRNCFTVPLSSLKEKKGEIDSKWKIIVNMEIEIDL